MVQLIQGLQKPGDGASKEEWDTKGVQTRRQPSNQGQVGGELVCPVA